MSFPLCARTVITPVLYKIVALFWDKPMLNKSSVLMATEEVQKIEVVVKVIQAKFPAETLATLYKPSVKYLKGIGLVASAVDIVKALT